MAANTSSPLSKHCSSTPVGLNITTSFVVTKVLLLLPLSVLVLRLGLQRWRQPRCFAAVSHSDVLTYHFAVMEAIFALGASFYFCGKYGDLWTVRTVGYYTCSVVLPGQTSFHILACVERYLAIVHPVVYVRLRQSRGVRIRNLSIGCAWLLCFGWIGVTASYFPYSPDAPTACFMFLSLAVVSFCSLSVLHALLRPAPGEAAAHQARVSQSKQRAFHTIAGILVALWLLILGCLVGVALNISRMLSFSGECVVLLLANFLILPNSLVLPLLFLRRAGKLPCGHSSR